MGGFIIMEKFSECNTPFTKCWCETRPKNPHCKDSDVIELPIDSLFLSITIVIAIILIVTKKIIK
jgi:hypothetical protein